MRDRFADVRYHVWQNARRMWEAGLVVGSSGNVSASIDQHAGLIAITPTSITYEDVAASQIAILDLTTGRTVESREPPSYEWPMHRAIYRHRADVGAVVHTHSPYVTALSVLRRPLPPVIDEMMIYFGGPVDVAEYAFTGTDELGENVVQALGDRSAAMLAKHGNVCVAGDLAAALHIAVVMEACAQIYMQTLHVGEPASLPDSSITQGRTMFEERRRRRVKSPL